MKLKIFIILFVISIVGMLVYVMAGGKMSTKTLVSPFSNLASKKVETSPTPNPTPKTFLFNESTDLDKELIMVNPKVEESDFESLRSSLISF